MVFFAALSTLLASGSDFVIGFASLGGLAGLAALATVIVNWRSNKAKERIDVKSVAITELEKAVPGLGDIIEQWQSIVHQLQADLSAARSDLEICRKRLSELEGEDNV